MIRMKGSRAYHQLGLIARDRGRLDEAEDCHRKSLAIDEALGTGQASSPSYWGTRAHTANGAFRV
jgi:hypothetical protein